VQAVRAARARRDILRMVHDVPVPGLHGNRGAANLGRKEAQHARFDYTWG
jgi:hypothetical protein